MTANLYKILGVSKEATTDDINKAFRKRALKCHPDKTSTLSEKARELATEEFKKLNNAHKTLTNSIHRQKYDLNDTDEDQPKTTHSYQSADHKFTKEGLNGRVKLKGASKSGFTVHNDDYRNQTLNVTLLLAKDSLEPMLQRVNDLVETLNNKAFKLDNNNLLVVNNKEYKVVANQMTTMYYEIMSQMNKLNGNVITYQDMLFVLQESQKIINTTQDNSEFANHRSLGRNCPILRELCVCLDLMANFFAFLSKKIERTISGEKTPVFATMQEFKYGMFKPIPTSTTRKVEELKVDIAWYIEEIEDRYQRAKPVGY